MESIVISISNLTINDNDSRMNDSRMNEDSQNINIETKRYSRVFTFTERYSPRIEIREPRKRQGSIDDLLSPTKIQKKDQKSKYGISYVVLDDVKYRYFGDILNKLAHGNGDLTDSKANTIFKGSWLEGLPHGKITEYYPCNCIKSTRFYLKGVMQTYVRYSCLH